MKQKLNLLLILNFLLLPTLAKSNDIFIIIGKKQEAKKSSRWSLADWMLTRKTIDAQNRWLALNSSTTLFEGILTGDITTYDKVAGGLTTEKKLTRGSLEIYLSIFGLMGEYGKSNEKYITEGGQFILRLFGKSSQDTSIAFTYGYTQGNDQRAYRNNYFGAKTTIYLAEFLGVDAEYRDYNDAIDVNNQTVSGYYRSYGGFVELHIFRIYAQNWTEKLGTVTRSGVAAGLKIFF